MQDADRTVEDAVTRLEFDAPVDEVTVLEDRAHVIRRGEVTLAAGATRLRIKDVAPILADKTLCADVEPIVADGDRAPGDARVSDVRIQRARVARDVERTVDTRALTEEKLRIEHELFAHKAEVARVRRRLSALDRTMSDTLGDIAEDVSWGRTARDTWTARLAELGERERALRDRALALDERGDELEAELTRLRTRMSVVASPRDAVAADLVVEVHAPGPGRYRVRVDYVVPGACWRPHHRATLVDTRDAEGRAATQLQFSIEGCVWQNTGEDWTSATLILSTERLSLGTEPPRLTADVLRARKRQERIEVQVRQQQIQNAGLGGKKRGDDGPPGIDDGGEVLALRTPHRVRVRSDGRPHRVALSEFTTPARCERVLLPELTAAALFKSTHVNGSRHPILAGPVDLIRGGGFVGRSTVLFIAPGERFELGWGPDGAIRIRRHVEKSVEESSMLSSWTTTTHEVELRLSNLSPEARSLELTERVPVSEIEKVKIAVDPRKTEGGKLPDKEGFVKWSVTLKGSERRTLKLVYSIKKHSDVSGL